jgi:hypothetical protein
MYLYAVRKKSGQRFNLGSDTSKKCNNQSTTTLPNIPAPTTSRAAPPSTPVSLRSPLFSSLSFSLAQAPNPVTYAVVRRPAVPWPVAVL